MTKSSCSRPGNRSRATLWATEGFGLDVIAAPVQVDDAITLREPPRSRGRLAGDRSVTLFGIQDVLSAWEFDPAPTVGVGVAGLLYLAAWRRLRSKRPRVSWPRGHWVAFGVGLLLILVAADGPPDSLSPSSFSAHMVQHLLIQLGAAPLLLLGAPVTLLLRADPRWLSRRTLVRALRSRSARAASEPLFAFAMFAAFLVGSHLTPLYELALERAWVHQLEHVAYLLTALLFWWPVIGTDPAPRPSHPVRLLYLFLIMPVMAFLGVALTSSESVLYPYYAAHPPPWGASALADQHLAGVLMWESGTLAITPALAVVMLGWLNQAARDQARRESAPARGGTGVSIGPARRPPADL
jgi:cytochrome c oxidase assembly factor CtaG